MKFLKFVISVIWICVIGSVSSIPNSTKNHNSNQEKVKKRSKRYTALFPWLPYNTCIALAVVLAIPLNLKGRNVYMSFNFETNFYMPYFDIKRLSFSQGLVPLPFATIDAPAVNSGTIPFYESGGQVRKLESTENNANALGQNLSISTELLASTNVTDKMVVTKKMLVKKFDSTKKNKKSKQSKKKSKKTRVNREILRTLLSRKKFYKILEHKLEMAGYNGEECLLKTICETAEQPLAQHNGVLGDIIHIIFTPTASQDEKLPLRYYDAITDGQVGRCRYYNTLCPLGIYDFITKTL